MTARLSRSARLLLAVALLLVALTGCGGEDAATQDEGPAEPIPIRIGTLPTEDALPLWVAQVNGATASAGASAPKMEIVTFQSAQERDAALVAGNIDAFMGDIIAAVQLEQGGTPVTIATVMLGSSPKEGRFGIVAAPKSKVTSLKQLANVPIGTSSGTIQEYVLDGLMEQAGVPAEQVIKEEVKKVPVRFELLMSGNLKAAALPEPLLTLAEKQGAVLVADDTSGENLSQTVLVVSEKFERKAGGLQTLDALLRVWDEAVGSINADPASWRGLLVEKARLPEPLKDSYQVNTYPTHQIPTSQQVNDVLGWMRGKDLLKENVTYEDLVLLKPRG